MLEDRRDVLFQPEAEALLEALISQTKTAVQDEFTQVMESDLAILRECKEKGIAEAFERLIAAQRAEEKPGLC